MDVDDVVAPACRKKVSALKPTESRAAKQARTSSIPRLVPDREWWPGDGPLDLLGQDGGDAVAVIGGVPGEASLDGGELGITDTSISR